MRERLAGALVGISLLGGCSSEIGGTPKMEKAEGELEIEIAVDGLDFPGLGGNKRLHLEVGSRVIGICLVHPSWESETIGNGFMEVEYNDSPELYVPTLAPMPNGTLGSVFNVSEKELSETYIRCDDERRK